jgi:hypothetical protein
VSEGDPVTAQQEITVSWNGIESVPVHMANQFLMQIDAAGLNPDQVVLAVGQATPPVVLGTPEHKAEQLRGVATVQVIPLARYSLTPTRLKELVEMLTKVVDAFEQLKETGKVPEL